MRLGEPVVGPAEAELTAMPLPDCRFLVAYSDFQHEDADHRTCKAIKVREISCQA